MNISKLKDKITLTSYIIFAIIIIVSLMFVEYLALHDIIFVQSKIYKLSISDPTNNLILFIKLYKYPLLILGCYSPFFALLISMKPKSKYKKHIKHTSKLNFKDKKTYLSNFLNPGNSWVFTLIYYKAINKKIKVNIDKENNLISYTIIGDNMPAAQGSFNGVLKSFIEFQEKNIIRIKSIDPLSFQIYKEYKDIIIDIYENE